MIIEISNIKGISNISTVYTSPRCRRITLVLSSREKGIPTLASTEPS